ncbi:hypothetical protein MNBD_NITROSPINAE02-1098 [hydrothermal vent metagenome]|uniref:ATP-grasp domain-containing protein n=1 Tax=hydrothermal vent metagenome TaxID=652676 RepID=A0A3B1C1E2_9ZZZZ
MNIFIFEYFCGGGDIGGIANEAMMAEGRAMLNSALADFSMIDGAEAYFNNDFEAGLKSCQSALVIAPETGGILQRLTGIVCDSGKENMGAAPSAIEITGDKLLFAKLMEKEGIAHPRTCFIDGQFEQSKEFGGKWISKPQRGAGAVGIVLWNERSVFDCKSANGKNIAQEFIEGDPMSLSIVSSGSESLILSVNKQYFTPGLKYIGGEITDNKPSDDMQTLVNQIKGAIPGLNGYWGIDYVESRSGPVVIEVNPRFTSSYWALSKALDSNPAEMIVAAYKNEKLYRDLDRRAKKFSVIGELSLA